MSGSNNRHRVPGLSTPMRRAEFVRVSAAAVGAMSLVGIAAGCGGDDSSSAGSIEDATGTLDMYTWEGYDLPKETAAWQADTGITIKASYIGAQDDVATKLTSPGAKGIDSSSANQSFIDYFNELGIMSPITVEEIPELEKLYPIFQGKPWKNDDETFNSVPWTWGPLGITYAADRIEEPASWDTMFEPKYKGRVTLLDDSVQHVQMASVILGYNPDELTHEQLAEVKEFLIRVVKQSKNITATTGDQVSLMASGEIDLVFLGWTGIDAAMRDKGKTAITVIPKGGRSIGFADAAFVPPEADNRAAGLAFAQQLITGDVAAAAAKTFVAAVTNPEVVPLLDSSVKDMYPYDDVDAYFEQLYFPRGYPRGESEFVTYDEAVKAWEEIKAAA